MEKLTLTIQETADLIGICPSRVYKLIKQDPTFPAVVLGKKQYKIVADKLQNWLDQKLEISGN